MGTVIPLLNCVPSHNEKKKTYPFISFILLHRKLLQSNGIKWHKFIILQLFRSQIRYLFQQIKIKVSAWLRLDENLFPSHSCHWPTSVVYGYVPEVPSILLEVIMCRSLKAIIIAYQCWTQSCWISRKIVRNHFINPSISKFFAYLWLSYIY